MALWTLRVVFFVVAIALAVAISSNPEMRSGFRSIGTILLFTLGIAAIIGLDLLIKKKRIDLITSIYFGLIVGLFLTYIISVALDPMFDSYSQAAVPADQVGNRISVETLKLLAHSFSGVVICYICISVLWQTKDDFRFIIPYVEFARDSKSLKPYVLDTSVVIDGRIADILETGVIDNPIIMPRFVLNELQNIADSSDKLRRARGRRGLDVLNRLRGNDSIEMQVYERELPEMEDETVDSKLLILAKHLDGKVVTGDFNLNKVARLQNVPVINLNDIANSIKPVFLPGETINVKIVKQGEEAGQGIGYLDDGTMVVVEDGRGRIGSLVDITVTSMLQTSAGRMVFGKIADGR